jgi:hypothetical protein
LAAGMLARLRRVVDPAEIGFSFYEYTYNNPIYYIDPDGMVPAAPHEYTVNSETGEVKLAKLDYLNDDVIYKLEDYKKGNIDNGHVVKDPKILKELSIKRKIVAGKHFAKSEKSDILANLFIWLSLNTKVEWGFAGYRENSGINFIIATSGLKGRVKTGGMEHGFEGNSIIFQIHNHEYTPGASGMENFIDNPTMYIGDMAGLASRYKKYQNNNKEHLFSRFYIFFEPEKSVYQYTIDNPSIPKGKVHNGTQLLKKMAK